jgi:hypothetical protein
MDNSSSQRDQNRKIVARYFEEFWTNGNPDVVDEVCSEGFVLSYPLHGRHVGRMAVKKMLTDCKLVSWPKYSPKQITFVDNQGSQAFPDISFSILSPFPIIAEENHVVIRWIGGGTHTGEPFLDLPFGGLPESNSGREMRVSGISIYKLEGGKLTEEIGEESGVAALQHLGLLPHN